MVNEKEAYKIALKEAKNKNCDITIMLDLGNRYSFAFSDGRTPDPYHTPLIYIVNKKDSSSGYISPIDIPDNEVENAIEIDIKSLEPQ